MSDRSRGQAHGHPTAKTTRCAERKAADTASPRPEHKPISADAGRVGSTPLPARKPVSKLRHHAELLRVLVSRDLKIRYVRSYLGMLWSLLTPLSQILIFSFLFRTVMPLGIENYTAFVFCGVLSWTWFSASLLSAASIVVSSPDLVRRPGFPAAVLPVLAVVSNATQFLIALPLLLILAPIDGGTPGLPLLALPLVVAVQFLLTLAIAFPIASVNVRFRDMQHVVALVTMAAFYLTPVFYSSASVPERFQIIYRVNPMVTILDAYRDIVIRGTWPNLSALAVVSFGSAVLLVIAYWGFLRASSTFAEEL